MRIAAIELENFKGIGPRQRVELRPITLLFGPNSAGKSTVLQALHYAREILERHNVDPDVTIAGGLLDLGGFATLVHQHDLGRPVRIKLEIDLSREQGAEELPLNSGLYREDQDFSELGVRYLAGEESHIPPEREAASGAPIVTDYAIVQEAGIEIEVQWSEQIQRPYISRMAVELDGQTLAAIVSPPAVGRAQIAGFNFQHPLLKPADADGGDEVQDRRISPLEDLLLQLSLDAELAETISRQASNFRQDVALQEFERRVGVATIHGALPSLDHDLRLEVRDPEVRKAEHEQSTPRVRALTRLLSEMILGPARIARRCLSDMTYIGPLREIPSRAYRPQVSPDESRWAHGLAAWDLLHTSLGDELMSQVNDWVADPARLNSGYRLERSEYREISVPGPFALMFQRGLSDDDLPELQELYEQLPSRRDIILRDTQTGIDVGPSDVGVGLSQLIPVVVGTLAKEEGLLSIEQPELHIHPALQVRLGDLFAAGIRDDGQELPRERVLLIETHSEHIMLRLLRRVRETADTELPPGAPPLKPDDIAVIYVESLEKSVL